MKAIIFVGYNVQLRLKRNSYRVLCPDLGIQNTTSKDPTATEDSYIQIGKRVHLILHHKTYCYFVWYEGTMLS